MLVLMSRTRLPVRPVDSLNYGLFLRPLNQSQTLFVCLCSDPHTKGHEHHDAFKETACQTLNCSDVRTNRSVQASCSSDALGVQLFSCTIALITLLIRTQGLSYFVSSRYPERFCAASITVMLNRFNYLQYNRATHCYTSPASLKESPASLITHKLVGHKVVGQKKDRMEKV